jgi:cytochrome b
LKGYQLEKIWDPVTRLWHWFLVFTVVVGWSLGEFMSFSTIQWHFYLGYSTGVLILFRYVWGFLGPEAIRFRALLPTPAEVIQYLRIVGDRKPSGSAGHNPVGSLSVIAIILLLTAQVCTGLFVESDDFFESGPLAGYVPDEIISSMTGLHHLFANLVLAIVILHVSAILFYLLWKKENLVKPMITGLKWVKKKTQDSNSQDC